MRPSWPDPSGNEELGPADYLSSLQPHARALRPLYLYAHYRGRQEGRASSSIDLPTLLFSTF